MFKVEHMDYGILITGTITLPELTSLLSTWDVEGLYEVVDTELGSILGGVVVANKNDVEKWKKELKKLRMKVVSDDTSGIEDTEGEGEGADIKLCP